MLEHLHQTPEPGEPVPGGDEPIPKPDPQPDPQPNP